ncbi:hypothetical protein SBX64_16105 [Vibrio rhizosphaerae]|uniref:Uncharacterized protein n=1 Tax=Vibrio rhizosphaerae TaxID=398736 RepID=A0ABU4IY24_9VIBR|nr:hypothetical protein [Vibrio rhizosphaerae]MDW6094063.1 hypothetical protein [Vibrio rhizosphaerae]
MGIASDTYARIVRQQYSDWYSRFYPKQQELLKNTQSGVLLDEQLDRVDENAASSLAAAQQGESNKMARYGLSSTPDASQHAKSSLASVSAKNSLRDYERERSMNVLSGAAYGLKSQATSQSQ